MMQIEKEKEKEKSLEVSKKTQIIDNECDTIITEELLDKYQDRTLINFKYIFKQSIGKGGFGAVYSGKNIISGEKVAIKFEETNYKQRLPLESKIMNRLLGINGVPKLRYYGTHFDRNIIVMDLYSHTLIREIENLRNGINVDNHEIIKNTKLIHDSRYEHNTPDMQLINYTINYSIVEEIMTILNPTYKNILNQNNILENVNSNDTDETEETISKYEETINEYYSKLNIIQTNITNIKGKKFDILSNDKDRDTLDELNKDMEFLNSKKKEILKDVNNIISKIINHKDHELNKKYSILKTNNNSNILDINNENLSEDKSIYSKDEDNDVHNESTFEVVECDKNCDTNVDKSKNYIIKEVTKYFIMILQIIKKIHDRGIVHRDIKPNNIMIDLIKLDNGCTEKRVYLIDFGLSYFYITNKKHVINFKTNIKVGTDEFMSNNIYKGGNDYSRRDDIISILYTVIYLIKGRLPWSSFTEKYNTKSTLTSEEVCLGIPSVFKKLLDYAYSLKFEERPDYSYMIRQLKLLLRTL
jgi:hypothetical protein